MDSIVCIETLNFVLHGELEFHSAVNLNSSFYKWYMCMWFVRNDDVRRLMNQPKLTAIIQSRWLTLFGHIMRMDDNADAKRILLASPPADWRRQLGRPRIMWLSTVQQDLKHHHLTLPKAADLTQNRQMWRMMWTFGATQSWVACQKRRWRRMWSTSMLLVAAAWRDCGIWVI